MEEKLQFLAGARRPSLAVSSEACLRSLELSPNPLQSILKCLAGGRRRPCTPKDSWQQDRLFRGMLLSELAEEESYSQISGHLASAVALQRRIRKPSLSPGEQGVAASAKISSPHTDSMKITKSLWRHGTCAAERELEVYEKPREKDLGEGRTSPCL